MNALAPRADEPPMSAEDYARAVRRLTIDGPSGEPAILAATTEASAGPFVDAALPEPIRLTEIVYEPPSWLVDDFYTAGDFGLFVGEDGSMKSTMALHLGLAVAGGHRAFARYQARQAPVLFVSGEDPGGVLQNRAEAMCRGHGWNADATMRDVHVLAMAGVDLMTRTWIEHLRRIVERLRIGLVILDPLAELATGEEDSNTDRGAMIRGVRGIGAATGAAVLVVHHFGKPAEGRAKKHRIRGASALIAAARVAYAVERLDDGSLAIECLKLSRAQKPAPFIVRHAIETDSQNRAIWTRARFEYVSAGEAQLDRAEEFILEQLAAGVRMNTTELRDAAKEQPRADDGKKVSGADLSRALKVLAARGRIDFEEGKSGARLWGLFGCRENLGNPGNPHITVAGQADGLPGNLFESPNGLPAPIGGATRGLDGAPATEAGLSSDLEAWVA